jgi:4-oxalocrotonate tautomerase
MPIINITTWPTPAEIKERMMKEVTRVVHEVSGAPLDKITVYFQEISKDSWSEAGVLGSDPDFPSKSRKSSYEK